jgi:two-component system response regulator GlrR
VTPEPELDYHEPVRIPFLIGDDPVFVRAMAQLPRMARSELPVTITGETGTGKELCARALHELSARRGKPFVTVDCGTVPDHLFENELFGHARGAYTDAHRDQGGLVAMGTGGTLFLDEIDALSLSAQGKLLRLIQERTYRPLGGDRFYDADVRIVVATNSDLEQCVRQRAFRSDLYFRLNVLRVRLPPLRERPDDVRTLATHFARDTTRGPSHTVAPSTLRKLAAYDWPGNVRELRSVIQRAAVLADGDRILPTHIELADGGDDEGGAESSSFRTARAAAMAAFERRYVEDLLSRHAGNVTHAAREADKDRRAFGRLIKKHGISRERWAEGAGSLVTRRRVG